MKGTILFSILLSFLFITLSLSSAQDKRKVRTVTIGKIIALPGETTSGFLEVAGGDYPDAKVPISIINGSQPGPTLVLTSGVHGYEYPPIEASIRMRTQLDPKKLSGTVLLVHICNLQAFQKRTIYYNPYDWLNLNHIFAGNPTGSISRRIAHAITQKIIKQCDYLIDLHCGDGNESLIPHSYWSKGGNPEVDDVTKQLVEAFGLNPVIIEEYPREAEEAVYLDNTAIQMGKPAFTIESGQLGMVDEESVQLIVRGIDNVLKYLKMVEGEVKDFGPYDYIKKYQVIRSNYDGIFYPLTTRGSYIKKDQIIGYVTDYFGNKLETIVAPFSGQIMYIVTTPPANKGEPLAEVGEY